MLAHVPGIVSESQGLGHSSRHCCDISSLKLPFALAMLSSHLTSVEDDTRDNESIRQRKDCWPFSKRRSV